MRQRPGGTRARDLGALAGDLRVAAGQLSRRLREQSSIGDLTRSQLSVLSRLEREGPATTSALARAEGIRPQSMGAIVTALEEAGYVSGAPDPVDGRKTVLSLTPATRERYADGRLAREDWLFRAMSTRLTEAEQAQLPALIEVLRRLADSPLWPDWVFARSSFRGEDRAIDHAGFNVTLAVDAMTDTRPDAHGYAIGRVFPRLGETGTTGQIIALLDQTRG